MSKKLQEIIKGISLWHLAFIIALGLIIINFILSASFKSPIIKSALVHPAIAWILFLSVFLSLFFIFTALASSQGIQDFNLSAIILSPLALFTFWNVSQTNLSFFIPLAIIITHMIIFFAILSQKEFLKNISARREKIILGVLIALYFSLFVSLNTMRFHWLAFTNYDFAIYNQTFWNTIHARPFQNSAYGSNFACHNTLFFFLLVPFYYLFPHPLTLLIAKNALLALAAIPFYLIAKDTLKEACLLPLTAAFMCYPFIAAQNLTPPYEIGFSPFFILFTYYFFKKNKFLPFICFLLLTLAIKEHIALIALMFGFYALLKKRSSRWVAVPMVLGIVWGASSLALINHFRAMYHAHDNSAWFITSMKNRFLPHQGFPAGLSNANITSWFSLKPVLFHLYSLGIMPPLLSPVSILGLPELMLNLITDRPALLSPLWHYNIVVSCFLLVGTLDGIKRISESAKIRSYLGIEPRKLLMILSFFVLASTLIHAYTWVEFFPYQKNKNYRATVKEAIARIPRDASLTVPPAIALSISQRKNYSITNHMPLDDYVLREERGFKTPLSGYTKIFHKNEIVVYKKNSH